MIFILFKICMTFYNLKFEEPICSCKNASEMLELSSPGCNDIFELILNPVTFSNAMVPDL